MTRDDFTRTLRMMEHARELSYEAETARERRRLTADYNRVARAVKPYITGKATFDDDSPKQTTLFAA